MATLRYTNCILTLIAICLGAIALEHTSMISTAVAQPASQPMAVTIVGFQLKQGLPINITGLGGRSTLPVAIVGQTGAVNVSAVNAIPVTNAADGSSLSVQIAKAPANP